MMWALTLLLLGLAFGVDLNQIKDQALDYANQGGNLSTNTQNSLNNIVCSQGQADCSYQGQGYQNYSQESQARQEYLNQANDSSSPLGKTLLNMWRTSDVKSTLYYQEATKLYQCDRVSPDGRCERYVGESYYGECQTVVECVSQTTQQSYAEYMCYIDSQGQTVGGESRYLCYVYNQIEPTVREKEYVCHVVNVERIRTCDKNLQVSFGQCADLPVETNLSGNAHGTTYFGGECRVSIVGSGNRLVFSGCMNGTITAPTGVTFSGQVNIVLGGTTRIHSLVGQGGYISVLTCSGGICYSTAGRINVIGSLVSGSIPLMCMAHVAYYCGQGTNCTSLVTQGNRVVSEFAGCPQSYYLEFGNSLLYKCSLNNQTYNSKSECYANCYTENINDCTVQ